MAVLLDAVNSNIGLPLKQLPPAIGYLTSILNHPKVQSNVYNIESRIS